MDSIKTLNIKGNTVEIFHDEFGVDPRDWDNLGTMVCWHRNYILGDEHDYETWQGWILELVESTLKSTYQNKIDGWYIDELWGYAKYNNIPNPDSIGKYPLNTLNDILDMHFIILPLYLYDHGGITMNTSGFYCPWDSGQVGYIYVSKKRIKEEYNWKYLTSSRITKIKSYLESEVEVYNLFIQGRTYGYVRTCDTCGEEDSCWGFYGEEWEENGMYDYIDHYCSCVEHKYNELVAIRE